MNHLGVQTEKKTISWLLLCVNGIKDLTTALNAQA